VDLSILGFSFIFGGDPLLVWGVFDVFWGLHWLSFLFPWSSCWKSVNCGFWRTSGKFRVLLGWIYGFWGISFSFGGDPVLFGAIFDVFWGLRWVLVGFMLVVMVRKGQLWVLENLG